MWKKKRSECKKLARQAKRKGKFRRNQDSRSGQMEVDIGYNAIVLLCNRCKVDSDAS